MKARTDIVPDSTGDRDRMKLEDRMKGRLMNESLIKLPIGS